MRRNVLISLLTLGPAAVALAQSSIEPDRKHAWAENIGWTNWRDAGSPSGSQGVIVDDTFLSGFVWAENVGWINLGDGTPANSQFYANATGADFGVNRDAATDELFGLAWGENIGWINFDGGAMASPPNPARIEGDRLRGLAWGENIGWINLDDATHFVGLAPTVTLGDMNCDGLVNFFDIDPFILALFEPATYAAQYPACEIMNGDMQGDGLVNFFDIDPFVACIFGACP